MLKANEMFLRLCERFGADTLVKKMPPRKQLIKPIEFSLSHIDLAS